MRLPITLCALVLVASPSTAQPRHGGVFAYGGTSEECAGLYVTTQRVQAYARPQAVGSAIRQVEAGRRIEPNDVSDVLTVVMTPGRFVARRHVSIDEWGYHDSDRESGGPLQIPQGMSIEVFGRDIWRMNGVVYRSLHVVPGTPEQAAWMEARRRFRIESFPRVGVWMRLVPRGSQPAAWLNVNQPGVRRTGDAPGSGPDC